MTSRHRPEKLIRAMLLQVFYSVHSARRLMEHTQYNFLFRWFIGLSMDDSSRVALVFSKNRERLNEHDTVIELFNLRVQQADAQQLLSGEHFSVDGSLIQSWASHKRVVRRDRTDADSSDGEDKNDDGEREAGNSKGQKRSNESLAWTTGVDTYVRRYRKGKTARELRLMGHTLTDNRHCVVINARLTQVDGYAEGEAAKAMINDARQAHEDLEVSITLDADKGYDAKEFMVKPCKG